MNQNDGSHREAPKHTSVTTAFLRSEAAEAEGCAEMTEVKSAGRRQGPTENFLSGTCGTETKCLYVMQEHSLCERPLIHTSHWVGHLFTFLSCTLSSI